MSPCGGACKTLNGGAVSLSPCFTSHFDFKCIQASGIQIKKEKSNSLPNTLRRPYFLRVHVFKGLNV